MRPPLLALFPYLGAALALALAPVRVEAQGTILDSPASFALGADHFIDSSADLMGVSASLEVDHLFAAGWWYRIAGDQTETFLPTPDDQSFDGAQATLSWNDVDGRGFGAVETDTIVNAGGPSGRVTLSLAITNLSEEDSLSIDVFHMADIDLNGSVNDSAVEPAEGLIRITDGADTAEYFASGLTTFLVAPSGASDVATALFNGVADEFDDVGLPFGPGDVTAGFQWETTVIPPSGTATFTVVIAVNTAAVPGTTPTTTTSATVAVTTTTTTSTVQSSGPTEACDNCADDDGDGLVDFEDPDCCPALTRGAIRLTKGKLKRSGVVTGANVALNGTLPLDVLPTSPATVAVTLQIARPGEKDLLCARIPAATFRQRKGKLVFREAIAPLDLVTISRGKTQGKLAIRAKAVPLEVPGPGPLTVTFGLRDPAGTANQCAIGSGEFQAKKKALTLR